MWDKKQIQEILSEFKLGHRASETTSNINKALEPGTANECTVQWRLKKFYKGDKSLEDEEHSGQPLEVDNGWLEQLWKLILLQLHEKLPKNSVLTILWLLDPWSKLERWKSSISECLMSWPEIKQIVVFKKCHLLVCSATSVNHLSTELWCMMKTGFYMTTSNSQLSGWTERKLQSTSPNQVC